MNLQEMATAVSQELPIVICILNNSYLGMVRQWQELFYQQRYSGTCMRYRKSCKNICHNTSTECPPYLPDFTAFAQSYGALGLRVTEVKDIIPAFMMARENKKTPTIIEFIIDSSELVLPMVQSGKPLADMIIS